MWVHPKGPLCHLPAVTEVSVENLSCGLCVLPTPTASSIDPDAPPAEDAGWVLGRMLSTGPGSQAEAGSRVPDAATCLCL